jgi:ATP-binding cassette subfamily C protein
MRVKSNLAKDLIPVFKVIDKSDKIKLGIVSILQFSLAILDLIGVALIGVIGALSVYGIQSKSPGTRIGKLLESTGLNNLTFQSQVMILGIIASLFLIIKTLLSGYLLRRTLIYTSRRGAELSKILFSKIILSKLHIKHKYTHQQLIYNATTSVESLSIGVLGSCVTLISDFSLLILMFIGLIYFNYAISIAVAIAFLILTLIINRFISSTAIKVGKEAYDFAIKANDLLNEFLKTYREAIVRNQEDNYLNNFAKFRSKSAKVAATRQFLPLIPKYIMEISLVFGGIVIVAVQLSLSDVSRAIGTLSIFLAAATRIAPAILRIQQGLSTLKSSLANTKIAIDFLNLPITRPEITNKNFTSKEKFNPKISLKNVAFTHENSKFYLNIPDLDIHSGAQVAFVGPSGSGKTTLIDLILGIQDPINGEILISGIEPRLCFSKYPLAVSYVPQDVEIVNGSVKHNILLGLDENTFTDDQIWKLLEKVKLDSLVSNLPLKLDSQVGESGAKLSGGQRQRLGIARALLTQPAMLVLDEATSALDSETELAITQSLDTLKGDMTILVIAHRLSTVRNSDLIVYLNEGKIEAMGKFDQVKQLVPNFARQAELMGLD